MKRTEKGQLFLQAENGDWMFVHPSSKTSGMLYLHDRLGRVYRLKIQDRVQVKE